MEEMGCTLRYITEPVELSDADIIILPGTKSTIADLAYLRQQKLDEEIVRQAKSGKPVIGICGGYQMLGETISDPGEIKSSESVVAGLGLLNIETVFASVKTTTQVKARIVANSGLFDGLRGMEVIGYEIHMGQTKSNKQQQTFQVMETPQGKAGYFDGAVNDSGLVFGSYLHGLSTIRALRRLC